MIKKLFFLFILFFTANCYAATYYMSTTGSDSNSGSTTSRWATFSHAFSIMGSGDTLIVGDGTYTQQLTGIPNGTVSNYTKIQAENNFHATVDYEGMALYINSGSYIRVEGIKFRGGLNTSQVTANIGGSNHIKVIRCSFTEAGTGDWNISVVNNVDSSYILFEECWAWGTGRYKFIAYQSNHIIFRRCVARHDEHHSSTQCATFVRYDSPNIEFQNCIAIDSGLTDGSNGGFWGGIWNENNAQVETTGKDLGCIMLNLRGSAGLNDYKISGTRTIENCIVWDVPFGIHLGDYLVTGSAYINHCTIGDIINDGTTWQAGTGVFDEIGLTVASVTNSIISQCATSGVNDITLSDYNTFFDNTANYINTSAGTNDSINDPNLVYITRSTSSAGNASDSGYRGATVEYKYGVDETLWGETGYETLTANLLWPFPNETEIKADMSTWSGGYVSGTRGFCATGTGLYGGDITLTSYIWEYLGNVLPEDIYGEAALNITTTSLASGTVGTAYSQTVSATGGTSPYTFTLLSGSLPDGLNLSSSGTISGTPTVANTFNFTIRVTDSAGTPATDDQALSIVIDAAPSSGISNIKSQGVKYQGVNIRSF